MTTESDPVSIMTTPNTAPSTATPMRTPRTAPAQAAPARAPAVDQFPDYPPRSDLMNAEHLHDHGSQPTLRLHLGSPETTVILSELPIYPDVPARDVPVGRRGGVRIPDLTIAFNIRRAIISAQKGYSISEQGKPPDFVLEVASDSTARRDETDKLLDYADFGIPEYWLFDPDWGRRYARGLMGWQLVNGRYEPIAIHRYAPGRHYGYSAVLGLYVCWEHGRLRWYDPAAGYLRTPDEERTGRIAAEAEAQRLRAEIARLRAAGADRGDAE